MEPTQRGQVTEKIEARYPGVRMGIPMHTLWVSAGYALGHGWVFQGIDGYFHCNDESVLARRSSRFGTWDSVQRSRANPECRSGWSRKQSGMVPGRSL